MVTRHRARALLFSQPDFPRDLFENEHLQREDEGAWTYTDWTNKVRWALLVGPKGEVNISQRSFDDITKEINDISLLPGPQRYYEEEKMMAGLGICPDCGCAYDEDGHCQCPNQTDYRWSLRTPGQEDLGL